MPRFGAADDIAIAGMTSPFPYHPWDERYIYLHVLVDFYGINVDKYSSPMDGMGFSSPEIHFSSIRGHFPAMLTERNGFETENHFALQETICISLPRGELGGSSQDGPKWLVSPMYMP